MAKRFKKKPSDLHDTYNRQGERILEGRTLNEWAAQYRSSITNNGWSSKALRARRNFDALLLQIQRDRAMENQPPLDRNSIEGITEADTFILAFETTRDDSVNAKAKASHEAREVSTTFTVNGSLTLYSTSTDANISDAAACRKRDLAVLQDVSSSSSGGKDRGCSLVKRLRTSSNLSTFQFHSENFAGTVVKPHSNMACVVRSIYDTIMDSGAACHVINNLDYASKD
jgi:hypothetical protein